MHNITFLSSWAANFNSDFSGNVEFVSPEGICSTVPFYVVAGVVAEKIKRDRMAALEQMADRDILK